MKGIQPRTPVITEQQYKAALTNLVILTKIGTGGWAVSHLYIPFFQ